MYMVYLHPSVGDSPFAVVRIVLTVPFRCIAVCCNFGTVPASATQGDLAEWLSGYPMLCVLPIFCDCWRPDLNLFETVYCAVPT